MSESIIQKLLDAAIVKNIYNIVTEDNGDNKRVTHSYSVLIMYCG